MVTRRSILAAIGGGLGVRSAMHSERVTATRSAVAPAAKSYVVPAIQSDVVPEPDPDGPVIVDAEQSDPSIPADGLTVTARASDPEGRLARIDAGTGENYVRIDEVPVSGRTDSATFEFETVPAHVRHGYPTLLWAVSADGRTGPIDRLEPPTVYVPVRAQFVSVNDPVPAGAYLEATVSVENLADEMEIGPLPDLHLVAGEVVDTTSVDVPAFETRTVQMGYETYPVESDVEFTLELIAGETLADTHVVHVRA